MKEEILLLDTSLIFDIIGINTKKEYINYDEILKARKCYSAISIYEMLNNKKFNKNEKVFKDNFKKVKTITQDVRTKIEFDIDDKILLNLDICNSEELEKIKEIIFDKLKPWYRNIYNSIIIAFANFMFSGIILFKRKGYEFVSYVPTAKEKKQLDYRFNQFSLWLDNYVEVDPNFKSIMSKDGIHKYFKDLTSRMLNYLIIVQKKLIRYTSLGFKYSNRFLNSIKKMVEDNYPIEQPISMSQMLKQVIENVGNPPNISFDLMKKQMVYRLCQMVRFNVTNDIVKKYFKTWIELRYNLTEENTRIENDIIDCLIACCSLGVQEDRILPIASDTKFINICCNGEEYKKYINFE